MDEALKQDNLGLQSLLSLYAQDVVWNCDTIIHSFDEVELHIRETKQRLEVPSDGHVIIVDSVLQRHVITIVNAAANVSKMIKPSTRRSKSETAAAHKFRLGRFKVFQSVLDGIDIHEIYQSGVRNALEHFDQDLDDAVRSQMRNPEINQTTKFYNWTFPFDRAIDSDKGITYMRVYLIEEATFVIFNDRINIRKVVQEAHEISRRVRDAFQLSEDAGRSAIVIK